MPPPPNVVLLAAGLGSRLAGATDLPKPLVPIGGVPLLLRSLRSFARAGVPEAAVVVGHRGSEIARAVSGWDADLEVRVVENPRWRLSNGVSVLAAREAVWPRSLLAMADHLLSPSLVERLATAPYRPGVSLLAVDRGIAAVFDPADATRVRTEGPRIVAIGKGIDPYDAIDTGAFRVGPELVEALAEVDRERGDCTLSEGMQRLSARAAAEVVDVTGCAWLDVDTPEAIGEAERRVADGAFA